MCALLLARAKIILAFATQHTVGLVTIDLAVRVVVELANFNSITVFRTILSQLSFHYFITVELETYIPPRILR